MSIRNIPHATKPAKPAPRRGKFSDPFKPRRTDDKKAVLLKLDEAQREKVDAMVAASAALRQTLLDFRYDHHNRIGRYPDEDAVQEAARDWKADHPDLAGSLPQGALAATGHHVHDREVKAAIDGQRLDWEADDLVVVHFAGGGHHEYLKAKDHRLYLPKIGWVNYDSRRGKGLFVQAVLEVDGTRIKGATLHRGQAGRYRAVLSLQRAPAKTINAAIKRVRNDARDRRTAVNKATKGLKGQAAQKAADRAIREHAQKLKVRATFETDMANDTTTIGKFIYAQGLPRVLGYIACTVFSQASNATGKQQDHLPVKHITDAVIERYGTPAARQAKREEDFEEFEDDPIYETFKDARQIRGHLRAAGIRALPRKRWCLGRWCYVYSYDDIDDARLRYDAADIEYLDPADERPAAYLDPRDERPPRRPDPPSYDPDEDC
jgi:hypothetical protein